MLWHEDKEDQQGSLARKICNENDAGELGIWIKHDNMEIWWGWMLKKENESKGLKKDAD